MSWEPELEELRRREELARRMGGEERVARQHASGRLTVRERIERLFDAGTFHETGALAGRGTYGDDGELTDFLPANTIVGQGRIDGRRAVVQGDDFTVRGGAADAAIWEKAVYAERMAHDLRLPLVRLVDGTGGGGSVKTLEQMGFSYVPPLPGFDLVVKNLSIVPVAAAALGPVAGPRRRARGVLALLGDRQGHAPSCSWPARPWSRWRAWARRPTRRSSAARACRRAPAPWTTSPPTRTTRSPSSSASSPTCPETSGRRRRRATRPTPPTGARRSCSRSSRATRASPTRCAACSRRCSTAARVFELGAAFGRPTITCLARLGGRPVGVLASDPEHYGGGVTADAAEKTARFVDTCDQFHLPVVNFVDVPGFVIGTAAERAGTIRRGSRGLFAVVQASVPWVSILVRKVYGVAGAGHGDGSRLNLRFAWPSGNWGSLPMAGGLEAAYRRELEAAEDPAALREEIAARLEAVTSPVPHRRALQRRGDHRPARHPPDPLRLGRARARAGSPRAAPGTEDARPASVI